MARYLAPSARIWPFFRYFFAGRRTLEVKERRLKMNFIIYGDVNVGKTTLVEKTVKRLRDDNIGCKHLKRT
ncbi:hypothetical protein AKJ65_05670 [candidate division MSBL1 archaeon SCGC-AAA259E19]|uniref:Uncharacterized protein n=1 Tax=candidate division MSBL1 archaeon SCGC-AAA259E19 TaxID=1698264 RepID=A0A133UIM4_9EURY|nr:hypothetical protein AKJ65_05670 [candidate division MSBL1 archaeon SCGC-AAA259E19]